MKTTRGERSRTIVLACGGTGGHIFPAFSVAEEIKKRDPAVRIVYACGKRDIEAQIFKNIPSENIVFIHSAPLKGGGWFFPFKLAAGFGQSLAFLLSEKPVTVVGFGGYFSFPVVLAARCLGIRTLIHEQNVIPGAANKALARWVDGTAVSFRETQPYFRGKVRLTGNPIRASIERDCREEGMKFFGFSPDKLTVLVLGGSQGAESLNTLFLKSVEELPPDLKNRIQVLHLCGRMPFEAAEAEYRRLGIPAKAYSFFDRMDLAYGASDFAVGRAGATFLAEIAAKSLSVILVPYPFGDGHQSANAELFCRFENGVTIEQKHLTQKKLAELLTSFITRPRRTPSDTSKRDGFGKAGARALLADFILENA